MSTTTAARLRAGGRAIEISHPDKVLFPQDGITKLELAEYYLAAASAMLPHLGDRPLNLQRFPSGIGRPGFFQQKMPDGAPDWIESVTVRKEGGRIRHLVATNAATLVYLANLSCITMHGWLSRRDQLDHPDQLVFDLDPPTAKSGSVAGAAKALGALLQELGVMPFLKTSGSRGYHVVVTLDRRQIFDEAREFAREVAEELVRRRPSELTLESRKQARRGRIYVDVMRNAYAHTVVPPYVVRAKRGAPVATPIRWEELDDAEMHPARFTMRDIPARLEAVPDPWRDVGRKAKPLAAARRKLREMTTSP